MEWIRHWVEKSPYGAGLGIKLDVVEPERVVLSLPYDDSNSNGDKALHGLRYKLGKVILNATQLAKLAVHGMLKA